ncbi:aldo/keto reductase [Pseudomonas matsuisoli]|uniref:Oxidoreductase n=1 Tax=Pseudomonas matsuisoli TaxID=1515666 RepID=A0A917UYU1_9PSED|nr:aldo/keto reductase [Pseudomonas matsuisoli]GGJ98120.1 oxidoreductase [Pseudomonas matsuisoli]
MQTIETHDGLSLPKLGLGTWPTKDEECRSAVLSALELGYRHIDTAAAYENEDAVGTAIQQSSIAREELRLTTKIWWDQLQPDAMRASTESSLRKLKTDYVDLLMIHWPGQDWEPQRALETLAALKEEGKARHIGVANFPLALLRQTVEEFGIVPAALQVEYHVLLGQRALLDYTQQHKMAFVAYCPLARMRVSEVPQILTVAAKHYVKPTTVALKWLLMQPNVAAIPKASGRENQKTNLEALDLPLTDDDLTVLNGLPKNQRLVDPEFAPKWDPLDT